MNTPEERLLDAIFQNTEDELDDNYPETITEKVGYSEYVITASLQNVAKIIQRLSRLHNLLIISNKNDKNELPEIIINNELHMTLSYLLQVNNDVEEITKMLTDVYSTTKSVTK